MTRNRLTIGIPTAGRPEAIQRCLKRIERVVDHPHEIIVLDNTPEVNSRVSYQNVQTVFHPDEKIGPGESRARIAAAADTDLLLFLDDDTLPKTGSVTNLVESIDEGYNIASGIWTENGSFENNRSLGHIFEWGFRNGRRTLIDVPISPGSVREHGFKSVDADLGLPTVLVHTDLFDSVSFDSRYDWFYEWLDFFLQTHERGERVCARLDAQFEHADMPYQTTTIKSKQERNRDRERFLDKWGIELCRDAAINSESWAQSESQSRSLDRAVAQAYADGGISCVVERAMRKFNYI